jgi:non-ribosomal peptide synthetase component F
VAARPTAELEQLVAVTVNLVPVRVQVDDARTGGEFLEAVQRSLARSLSNSALPFADLVAELGLAGEGDRHPLVQAAFGMHDGVIPDRLTSAGLDVSIEEVHCGGSQFDLELFIQR